MESPSLLFLLIIEVPGVRPHYYMWTVCYSTDLCGFYMKTFICSLWWYVGTAVYKYLIILKKEAKNNHTLPQTVILPWFQNNQCLYIILTYHTQLLLGRCIHYLYIMYFFVEYIFLNFHD